MRTTRWLLLLLLFTLLLFIKPAKSLAFSLQNLGTNLSASTNSSLYRLRAQGKSWQLSALSADQLVDQPIAFGGQLIFSAKTGDQWKVYRSTNGLDYFTISNLVGDAIRFIERDQLLFAAVQNSTDIKIYAINQNFDVVALGGLPSLNINDADRLLNLNGEILYGEQQADQLRIKVWRESNWQEVANLTCVEAVLAVKPMVGFSCQNTQFFYPIAVDNWLSLFSVSVQNLTFSNGVIAANDSQNNLFVWKNDVLTTYGLSLSGRTIVDVKTVTDRVFLKLSDNSWLEFDLSNELLVPTPGDVAGLFPAANNVRVFSKIGEVYWFSDQPDNWRQLAVDGDFTAVKKVTGGWLAWQSSGSLTQFSADDSSTFQKITTSWAASSKIQSVYTDDSVGFVLLLNASNNPNLYQTTGYTSWARITLPTAPTFSLPISQLRALPASSLVEVKGAISVPRGVVNSETIYVQDATGGIQIFLDSSRGQLPDTAGKQAIVTGQISTSQTKRVLLSAGDDLVLGADAPVSLPDLSIDELSARLGEVFRIQAVIDDAQKDFFLLKTVTGTLKFHFPSETFNFTEGSTVKLSLVVDYNSSSGHVETWSINPNAELVSSAATSSVAATSAAVTNSVKSSSTSSKATTATKTSQVSTKPSVTTPTTSLSSQLSTKVAAVKSKPQQPDSFATTMLVISGFLAGALVMRGQKLQKLFRF